MKKYTLLMLAFTMILPFVASAQLSNGLIAHWNFNGTVNDLSGNGHNGTANNISYGIGKMGASNTAAVFNGTSSFVSVPYSSDLNVSKFSICAVIKPTGYYSGLCQASQILGRGKDYQPGHYRLIYFDNAFDNHNCNIIDTSKNVFHTSAGTTNVQNVNTAYRYTPTIVTQNWYCVIGTFDGTDFKVYVDGVLKSTATVTSGSVGSSTDGLAIGANRFGSVSQFPYWLNGVVDDIRLYNRALSASEVAQYCGMFDTTVYISQSFADTLFCADDTVQLQYGVTDNFRPGNIFTAQLSDASGSFASPTVIGAVTSNIAGVINCSIPSGLTPSSNYRVRVVGTMPQRISDVSKAIVVHPTLPAPTVNISANPSGMVPANTTITFTATATNADSSPTYQWFKNGTAITGATNNTWSSNTLNDNDSVWAEVHSSNMCPPDLSSTSNKLAVQIESSVHDLKLNSLSLYPNPNDGSFILSASSVMQSKIHLTIINSVGQVVYKDTVRPINGVVKVGIEFENVASGVYLLRMSVDNKQKNIRFIVK